MRRDAEPLRRRQESAVLFAARAAPMPAPLEGCISRGSVPSVASGATAFGHDVARKMSNGDRLSDSQRCYGAGSSTWMNAPLLDGGGLGGSVEPRPCVNDAPPGAGIRLSARSFGSNGFSTGANVQP
jgi:hypothetical protein